MKFIRPLLVACLYFIAQNTFAQKAVVLNAAGYPFQAGDKAEMFIDTTGRYTAANVVHSDRFYLNPKKVFTSLLPENNIWIRVKLENKSGADRHILSLEYPNIASIDFYTERVADSSLMLLSSTGNRYPFTQRQDASLFYNFKIDIPADSVKTYYLHIVSMHPVSLPLVIQTEQSLQDTSSTQTLIIGLYTGFIMSILLYNLFLFFAVRDRSYIYYVFYLLSLLLAQLTFSGWTFKYLWPSHPEFNRYAVIFTTSVTGMSACVFTIAFLHVKSYSKVLYYILLFMLGLYAFSFLMSFRPQINTSYDVLNYSGLAAGGVLLTASGYVARKGYRPAYYYFIAWFIFAVGREVLSLRNLGLLAFNPFTTYILYIGSAIEAILLSLALADRINILQKEKAVSQAEALKVSKENERLVRDQNILLEKSVLERTEELSTANLQLNGALTSLKDAQAQLVDAEKMASLGQLTAGIAHEINNPINFVKSNINPLRLDIKDVFDVFDEYNRLHALAGDVTAYKNKLKDIEEQQQQVDIDFIKDEIYQLIKGIEDGAERTAEIVRGLRTFSRLDESELKKASVHDGLNSTIVLIRNNIPTDVQVIKNFNAAGEIECYPGKLNQVFMNIITNGLHAINAKPAKTDHESITISTRDIDGEAVEISIKDTGIGMTEEVRHRIFEPFFTTKDVGEGTGLGMAIVFKIIEKHHGKIDIISSVGNGAEFIITLPYTQPLS